MISRQVMASGEKRVLEHQTSQRVLHSGHQESVDERCVPWAAVRPRPTGGVVLTRKSPPHSCKQCRTSSWLVPPPWSTLEQAMFIKLPTDETETMTRFGGIHQKGERESKKKEVKWNRTAEGV